MRVLVTGATGFFGPGIVAALVSGGHDVIASARHPLKGVVYLDVTDPLGCKRFIEVHGPFDTIVHAAAFAHVRPSPEMTRRCRDVNVTGTRNVVDGAVAAGVRNFVYISSVTVYGEYDLPDRVTEDCPARPGSIYGETKSEAERIVLGSGMNAYVFRMTTMYSPEWTWNIRKRVRLPIPYLSIYFRLEPSARRYSLCSRDNGSRAVVWAVEGRMPPGTYNVADDYEYAQDEILTAIEQIEGTHAHVRLPKALPGFLALLARHTAPSSKWSSIAQSQYWKYCERNIYPVDKLRSYGFVAEPHLLAIGARRNLDATG